MNPALPTKTETLAAAPGPQTSQPGNVQPYERDAKNALESIGARHGDLQADEGLRGGGADEGGLAQ